MGRWIGRLLAQMAIGGAVLLGVLYGVDWMVWRGRGGVYGSMTVSRFVVAPLKGNKVEYYPGGTLEERCSRSVFGHGQAEGGACWWLERHRMVEN